MAMAASFGSLVFSFLFFFFPVIAQSDNTSFIFHGFNGSEAKLITDGSAVANVNGVLRLTDRSQNVIGHAFYRQSIRMFENGGGSSSAPNASSFSTSFVFAIVPPSSGRGGYGLAFTLAPSPELPDAEAAHYLGLLNPTNDGKASNHIFAVEFDTLNGFNDNSDSQGNHVGININSMNSTVQEPAIYYTNRKEDIDLESGEPIHAWIEYNGVNKVVNVTICPVDKEKPTRPLISESIDLTPVVKEIMYVGFSASTGKESSSHYILGWSFSMNNGVAPPLDLSRLSSPPEEQKDSSSYRPQVVALVAALSSVTVTLVGVLVFLLLYRRRMQAENLEDWELDCPHRFRYKDLHAATNGFQDSEVIGVGGFGAVYKGVLPTGAEVAVKKIGRNSIQGLREFAAEIESLGRLRHKNLVNLQGWCKHKYDLLIIYDYIPNGSLDSLLYKPKKGSILSWNQRFSIVKDICAGLLYLHEEWEQVVIHRDVKSSNVLIDADMNARLGDFGLARVYDHGKASHTTNVVGTIGYIAPELTRSGKASASSDVFAYGVLLLEVVSGRRPIDSGNFFLVDWVIECLQFGHIFDAVDPQMNTIYAAEEVKLVLGLGLLCCHRKPESRPTMRQVLRYLNGDDQLPLVDCMSSLEDLSSISSGINDEMTTRFLEVISFDMSTRSFLSTPIRRMTSIP